MDFSYITGGNGFIGTQLRRELDKRKRGYLAISHEHIKDAKLTPYNTMFFLSAYGNMYHHIDDAKIIQANVLDLIHLLFESMKVCFKSFIFVSSSSVELEVQTTYSRTKRASEEILLSYIDKYDLPICIIRPFSVTGPGEQKEHLIPTLIDAAYAGKQVNLVLEPRHDFIDVRDVVGDMIKLADNGAKGIHRLGNSIPISNAEVLNIVEDVTRHKVNINIVENVRKYDTENWYAKDYIEQTYGWHQRIRLEQSIRDMAEDYVKQS